MKLGGKKSLILNKSLTVSQIKYGKNFNYFNDLLFLPNPQISKIKEEILLYNKTQKEILLSLIKTNQLSLLSNLQKNKLNNKKSIIVKNIFLELKQSLSNLLKKKQMDEYYLYFKIDKIKKIVQQKIFKKGTKTLLYNNDEISKLKLLNFEIENEIEKIDFLIKIKNDLNKYLKIVNIFPEYNREIFYNSQKQNNDEIDEIYEIQLKAIKEGLNHEKNKVELQREMIGETQKEIEQYIEIKNNISSSDIIPETSLENQISRNDIKIKKEDGNNNDNDKNNEKKDDFFYKIKSDNTTNLNNVVNLNINLNINSNQYISKMFINEANKYMYNSYIEINKRK